MVLHQNGAWHGNCILAKGMPVYCWHETCILAIFGPILLQAKGVPNHTDWSKIELDHYGIKGPLLCQLVICCWFVYCIMQNSSRLYIGINPAYNKMVHRNPIRVFVICKHHANYLLA